MSSDVEVFIAYGGSFASLAAEVGSVLGVTFTYVPDDKGNPDFDRHEAATDHVALALLSARGLESPRLQPYEYYLVIAAITHPHDPAARAGVRHGYGRYAFEKLRGLRRYSLMLTNNMSYQLDAYVAEDG